MSTNPSEKEYGFNLAQELATQAPATLNASEGVVSSVGGAKKRGKKASSKTSKKSSKKASRKCWSGGYMSPVNANPMLLSASAAAKAGTADFKL